MATPKPPGTPKAKPPQTKAARNKKILLIGGGVIVAVLIGLYIRSRSGSSTGASSTGASPTDVGSGGGAGSSGAGDSALGDLAYAIQGLTGVIGAGQGFDVGGDGAFAVSPLSTSTAPASLGADTTPTAPFTPSAPVAPMPAAQAAAPVAEDVAPPADFSGSGVSTPTEFGPIVSIGEGIAEGAVAGASQDFGTAASGDVSERRGRPQESAGAVSIGQSLAAGVHPAVASTIAKETTTKKPAAKAPNAAQVRRNSF